MHSAPYKTQWDKNSQKVDFYRCVTHGNHGNHGNAATDFGVAFFSVFFLFWLPSKKVMVDLKRMGEQ